MPNRRSIYYTNMGGRRVAPGMCVWAASTMYASWDIKVYHCYSGPVLCVQHMLHLFHMCEFRSARSAPLIWIPRWLNNMTLAWHIIFIQSATLWLFPKITSDMPHPQLHSLLWAHMHVHEHVYSFTCCLGHKFSRKLSSMSIGCRALCRHRSARWFLKALVLNGFGHPRSIFFYLEIVFR